MNYEGIYNNKNIWFVNVPTRQNNIMTLIKIELICGFS